MKKFIKCTCYEDNTPVLVATDDILIVEEDNTETDEPITIIHLKSSSIVIWVKETISQIERKLR